MIGGHKIRPLLADERLAGGLGQTSEVIDADSPKNVWVDRLPSGPPLREDLARLVDSDQGRGSEEGDLFETANDPQFDAKGAAQRQIKGQLPEKAEGPRVEASRAVVRLARNIESRAAAASRAKCSSSGCRKDRDQTAGIACRRVTSNEAPGAKRRSCDAG